MVKRVCQQEYFRQLMVTFISEFIKKNTARNGVKAKKKQDRFEKLKN